MNFEIISTPPFEREAKRLAKKYPSLKSDLGRLSIKLSANPSLGTPLGHQCFKIRLSITSKGKGKSGGARLITHVRVTSGRIFLLSIYDKSEHENISNQELLGRLMNLKQ